MHCTHGVLRQVFQVEFYQFVGPLETDTTETHKMGTEKKAQCNAQWMAGIFVVVAVAAAAIANTTVNIFKSNTVLYDIFIIFSLR